MNSKVDWFFDKESKWQKEYRKLRAIVLDCGLTEELKWGVPCYSYQGKNVVLIHGFKNYCALLFHKGTLLNDTDNILIQQTENVQAARQLRFTRLQEIIDQESTIKTYIFEAVEVQKAGVEVRLKKTSDFKIPDEFQNAINDNQELKSAFEALTPGRQRGYLLHFSQAKQSRTRESRIEKSIPKIFDGKGYNE